MPAKQIMGPGKKKADKKWVKKNKNAKLSTGKAKKNERKVVSEKTSSNLGSKKISKKAISKHDKKTKNNDVVSSIGKLDVLKNSLKSSIKNLSKHVIKLSLKTSIDQDNTKKAGDNNKKPAHKMNSSKKNKEVALTVTGTEAKKQALKKVVDNRRSKEKQEKKDLKFIGKVGLEAKAQVKDKKNQSEALNESRELSSAVDVKEKGGKPAQKWVNLYRKAKSIKSVPYNMRNHYEAKTAIEHKVLGWGYILANKNDRLEVLFKDGVRYLISNYR